MYRIEDMEKIKENINKIKDESFIEIKNSYEPNLTEITNIYNTIKKYIIKNKKITYGGFAQNILLMAKNPSESFYKEINGVFFNLPDVADIEFYSPNPLADIIELTEELYSKGFKNITASDGVNPETYKIFVNLINYVDISYMSKHMYNNLPVININGIICVHPHFMMVDAYRVITDIMSSWRLDKSIIRFQKIIKYYPIDISLNSKKIVLQSNEKVLNFIRKHIIQNSKLIVVGFYAFDYYIKKTSDKYLLNSYPYYEVITTDLINDGNNIYNILKKEYGNKLIVKEFNKFFDFIDERIEYYYDNKLVLRLFGNNERCIVYRYSEKKNTYLGTYNLVFMYLLFDYYLAFINKNKSDTDLYLLLIGKIFETRNEYLNNHNISVIDISPFQDFTLKCFGKPLNVLRNALLIKLGKSKDKRMKFRYNPSGNPGKVPNYVFNDNNGNIKTNKNHLIIKK